MTFRRAGSLLLEILFPLFGIVSTPERRRYWRALPVRRGAKLFGAIFSVISGVAFFMDLLASGAYPPWSVLALAFVLGALQVVVALLEIRKPLLLFAPMLASVAAFFAFSTLRETGAMAPEIIRQRMVFDSICLFCAMMIGYRLFLSFAITEGISHVQLQTELSFAHAIQSTLVPPVQCLGPNFEAYGRTVPSDAVGGDLVDQAVAPDGSALFYVADVSGHGIPAGVLMGMLKMAVRQGILFGERLPSLLDSVNRVLPSVKEPNMYATLAGLRFDGSSQVEYTTAGHLPLLHYRHGERDILERGIEQFPLGLFTADSYASDTVHSAPGDIFAIVTDGFVETVNRQDQEFGLKRLGRVIAAHATEPLAEIFEATLQTVAEYGAQQDDRTLLLIRVTTDGLDPIKP